MWFIYLWFYFIRRWNWIGNSFFCIFFLFNIILIRRRVSRLFPLMHSRNAHVHPKHDNRMNCSRKRAYTIVHNEMWNIKWSLLPCWQICVTFKMRKVRTVLFFSFGTSYLTSFSIFFTCRMQQIMDKMWWSAVLNVYFTCAHKTTLKSKQPEQQQRIVFAYPIASVTLRQRSLFRAFLVQSPSFAVGIQRSVVQF